MTNTLAICTCVTADHLAFAKATFRSIRNTTQGEIFFYLLVVDPENLRGAPDDLRIVRLEELSASKEEHHFLEFYRNRNEQGSFRWFLKPFLVRHLLVTNTLVFWVDPDLFFFNSIDYAINKITNRRFLLSPHWKCFDPLQDPTDFPRNFYHGLFNGGFFGARKEAGNILNKWIRMMSVKLEYNRRYGLFEDQGYMGIFHLLADDVVVIRHRGYNLANWNRRECSRSLVDGKVLINGRDEVVFIHFTKDTIKYILNGEDRLLRPFLKHYLDDLVKIDPDLRVLKSHSIEKIRKITG